MAHRVEFKIHDDVIIPEKERLQINKIKREIKEIQERQQELKTEYEKKFIMMEKRIQYGKAKIFSPTKIKSHTISEEIIRYDAEIRDLKNRIEREERLITSSTNFQTQADPQKKIMDLTHEIMRLKKSIQEIKCKYNDNFTEQKMKTEYEKVKQENEHSRKELREIQKEKNFIMSTKESIVDYAGLENTKENKKCQILNQQKALLQEYLANELQRIEEENGNRELQNAQRHRKNIEALEREILYYREQNAILDGEIGHMKNSLSEKNDQKGKISQLLSKILR